MRVMVVVAGLLLAGCAEREPAPSAEHLALVEGCVAEGRAAETCECEADGVDALLRDGTISDKVLQAEILQSQGKEEEADAIMQTLTPAELFSASSIGEAKLACHAGGS
jgi:outer membrane PBP1 activator LpoA protein